MKLAPTNRTDYGIRALVYLANHQGTHAKAADIGSGHGRPDRLPAPGAPGASTGPAASSSRSGPAGGYMLARAPEDITILEIVETLEGPIADLGVRAAGRAVPLGPGLRHAPGVVRERGRR